MCKYSSFYAKIKSSFFKIIFHVSVMSECTLVMVDNHTIQVIRGHWVLSAVIDYKQFSTYFLFMHVSFHGKIIKGR